jgi:hypothetical protein
MSTPASTLREQLWHATLFVGGLDDSDADWLADRLVDDLIGELRRLPAFRDAARIQIELLLADYRSRVSRTIAEVIDGHADPADIIDAIAEALDEDDDDIAHT